MTEHVHHVSRNTRAEGNNVPMRRPKQHEHECRRCHRVVACDLPECAGIRAATCAVSCGSVGVLGMGSTLDGLV